MSEFRADLHCHTTCSDGSDLPVALLNKAAAVHLQGLSITDHDSIDAYTDELFDEAKKLGVQILSGIEISSEIGDASVHILGYGFDLKSESLKQFLFEMQKRRRMRNLAILEKLAQRQLVITEEELNAFATERTIGRPHIAQLMVQKHYVQTIKDAFDYFLREGASCYSPGIKYSPREVIDEIHKASGFAVLAHPHFIKPGSFLKKLLALPFDGLECYYSRLASSHEAPWLKMAKEKKLIATGGSDYHGAIKPNITLGCSWVKKETFDLLCCGSKAKRESGDG